MSSHSDPIANTSAVFENTRWTTIFTAAGPQDYVGQAALERLCQMYWPPIYSFLRKQGKSPEDAKDLTQGFFCHLLSKERLRSVHPTKGKFRSFLLACLSHFVSNEWDKARAAKRGGGQESVSFSISDDQTHSWEPADFDDPAKSFERSWATRLIGRVFEQLKQKNEQAGKSQLFLLLSPFLTGEAPHGGYANVAADLQMTEVAVRVAASRLRDDFRCLLRSEVGFTVSDPSEIDDEISYLIRVLKQS
jgi:DNA-directed RNA polymerase specialized sigma24 family protein